MNDKRITKGDNKSDSPTLRVVHKRSGNFEVFFPFSEVPVEMTKAYFEKNIQIEQYVIDIQDEEVRI